MSSVENILRHCQCGMCGHDLERDCVDKECKCCLNFHVRSGNKIGGKAQNKK